MDGVTRDWPSRGVTGIFYHPSFSRRSFLTSGRRLADFPGVLSALLLSPRVKLFQCAPVSDELILLAHDAQLMAEVEADPF